MSMYYITKTMIEGALKITKLVTDGLTTMHGYKIPYYILENWQKLLLKHINILANNNIREEIIERLTDVLNVISDILFSY